MKEGSYWFANLRLSDVLLMYTMHGTRSFLRAVFSTNSLFSTVTPRLIRPTGVVNDDSRSPIINDKTNARGSKHLLADDQEDFTLSDSECGGFLSRRVSLLCRPLASHIEQPFANFALLHGKRGIGWVHPLKLELPPTLQVYPITMSPNTVQTYFGA
ncbi:hypothetical protein AB1N83_013045 [Pleurotus pulmonarius]